MQRLSFEHSAVTVRPVLQHLTEWFMDKAGGLSIK